MAVSITPDGTATFLTDLTRPNFTMNQVVSASCTAPSGQDCNVTNVTATVQGTQPNLVITPGSTSVSITGSIEDPFVDEFTYIEQGESDKTQTPVTVQRIVNMPADKLFYDLNQDNTNFTTEIFNITVQWEAGLTGNLVAQTPATFTLELKIYNEWEGIRSFISNYY